MEDSLPYYLEKSLEERCNESKQMMADSTRIPVIIERAPKEKYLPPMDKKKFLVPRQSTLSALLTTVRTRLQLHSEQTLIMLINGRHLPTLSTEMHEVHSEFKAEDGFLYINYVSQEVFG